MAPSMITLKNDIKANNKASVIETLRELKKQSGRVGAGKLYYACYYMLQSKDKVEVMKFYQLLVEAVIELKRFWRKKLAGY